MMAERHAKFNAPNVLAKPLFTENLSKVIIISKIRRPAKKLQSREEVRKEIPEVQSVSEFWYFDSTISRDSPLFGYK
jgi:hypothetical protein